MRDQENYWRDQARVSGRSFDGRNFRRDYLLRTQWSDNTLRNVISNALGGNSDNYYHTYYTPQYDNYNYSAQYDPSTYDNGGYSYGYTQYPSYYATPYAVEYQTFGYQPYDYSYANSPYDNGEYPYYADYTNDFPIAYVTGSNGGGGFLSRIFSQLLAVGYDNGYQEGLYARSNGYGDQYYSDPYGYQDTGYDPYSYSVGENRRCLSKGYQLGYQDAMDRNNQYDRFGSGNIDLVSLLIGDGLDRG